MTDYELITAFAAHIDYLQSSVMNYVAVLFAFLMASYLIADKLQSSMVFIVVGLFTLVVLQQAGPIIGGGHDVAGLAAQIAARSSEGLSSLDWHGTTTPWGSVAISITRFSALLVLALSYVGAVIFFFHQRHLGRAQ